MGGKQIEVRCKKLPYTNIQNKLIWDERLRPQTKWVLIAMLSLPDDWDYSIRGLAKKTGLAKETISKMLGELEQAGYLKRKPQRHGEDGRFAGTEYILTDVAGEFGEESEGEEEAPCPNLPRTVKPCPVNSPQQNNILQTNILTNTPYSPPQGDGDGDKPSSSGTGEGELSQAKYKPEWFNIFYKIYPRHEGRKDAIKAWDKLKPSLELCRVMEAAIQKARESPKWQEEGGRYIPHASSWLNGRRWEDEIQPVAPESPSNEPLRGKGVRYE